ncbi:MULTISPECIES: hypothetical protein [Pseudomonas]|uniref:Uncharacterized protein n=1 Tax=Pseudomonas entomophila TaxID=312306 RepID=A0A3Q8TWE2_9PSED|nr:MULTISPECIES: hypothetical protein [Pseudomonas]AZL69904.1 hypothetical protein EJA05_20215 [Pseudomonas oryziphila]MDZ4020858.1 hypothetical protein [Pseudomonas sichuanensis]UVL87964.1 hypothetical protein LOY51_19560 [Pseudomonas sichuanensis]
MLRTRFTAELHCKYGQIVCDNATSDVFGFEIDDGWLCAKGTRTENTCIPLRFEFTFLEEKKNRLHYQIHAADTWQYIGATLEQNENGWLGMYATHAVGRILHALNPANLLRSQPYWKIELLQDWDGTAEKVEGVEFYLRDAKGHRVGQTMHQAIRTELAEDIDDFVVKGQAFLPFLQANGREGEVLKFHLRKIKLS